MSTGTSGKKPAATKPKKAPAKAKLVLEDYQPTGLTDDEDDLQALDEMINGTVDSLTKTKTNNKRKPVQSSLLGNLTQFEDIEAESGTSSNKKSRVQSSNEEGTAKTKKIKSWESAESACLRLLVVGSSPIGKNASGK